MAYTQAMTFAEIVAEVQAIRFNSAQDSSIQRWVNDRYGELWNADEWIFKYGQASNLTVTAGSSALGNLPSDFGMPLGLWRDDGYPVKYLPPRSFFDLYAADTSQGAPAFYTMFDQQVTLAPTPDLAASTFTVVYEKRFTPLVNDADVPAIPPQHHYLLVTGAMALGLRLYNDFTWEFQEQGWQSGIQAMRREWLVDQRGEVEVWGRDGVEALPTSWGV